MLAAMIASVILVGLTLLIHYDILRLASALLPNLPIPVRARVVVVVFAAFLAHTFEVWLYALAYFIFDNVLDYGRLGGEIFGNWRDFVYFSAGTYTTLGIGDIYPIGQTRLLAGIEALNGLVLIGWSASFTYLTMEKFWPIHGASRRSLTTG
jgi:Ion channel